MLSFMATSDSPFTFRDNPSLVLLPAGIFAVVGACFLVLGVQEVGRGARLPALGALAVGSIGLLCGYLAALHAERLSVTVDRRGRRISLVGRLPWRRRVETWDFDQVATVEPEAWDDGDGGPMWRPVLVLKGGRRVPLMANWRRDRELVLDVCRRARQHLQT